MKQTQNEARFIPIAVERGKARKLNKIRICYSLLKNMGEANGLRHSLFSNEGQGYKNALSYSHNICRFRNTKTLIPNREKEQNFQAIERAKNREKKEAILALKYGRKFGTTTTATILRAKRAGIKIKKSFIFPEAELQEAKRLMLSLLSSEMKGNNL